MLAGFGGLLGLEQRNALALGSCLGGCVSSGMVCGAVNGGLMILGLAHPDSGTGNGQGRNAAIRAARVFLEQFRARHGSTMCADLLGMDGSSKEGYRRALEQGLFQKLCPGYVASAAELAESLLPGQTPAS